MPVCMQERAYVQPRPGKTHIAPTIGSVHMAFGVFIHRSDSIYDDTPAERYQFPRQYLERARACLGDWIIYYEPRKVADTRGYYAVAKVADIIPDPSADGMYLALIEPGSYLDFATPVPFADLDGPIERGVLNDMGRISGRAQAAVRTLSPGDFTRIVDAGLADEQPLLPRTDIAEANVVVREERAPFIFDEARERVSAIVSRVYVIVSSGELF